MGLPTGFQIGCGNGLLGVTVGVAMLRNIIKTRVGQGGRVFFESGKGGI